MSGYKFNISAINNENLFVALVFYSLSWCSLLGQNDCTGGLKIHVRRCCLKTKHYICKCRYNDTFNEKHDETLPRLDISH